MPRRKCFARFRGTGLYQHGPPLPGPGNIEWPLHGEKLPLVVQTVHFRGIEEHAGGFIADKGVVFPRIPQAFGHVKKLVGNAIAQVMFRMAGLL